jgi:hypothetical protein
MFNNISRPMGLQEVLTEVIDYAVSHADTTWADERALAIEETWILEEEGRFECYPEDEQVKRASMSPARTYDARWYTYRSYGRGCL